jgi:hypothetical protein
VHRELRSELRDGLTQEPSFFLGADVLGPHENWFDEESRPNEWDAVFSLKSGGELSAFIDGSLDDSGLLAQVANTLQDQLADITSEPRPACPLHRLHPLLIRLDSDRALWVCPVNALGWQCNIGDYRGKARLG